MSCEDQNYAHQDAAAGGRVYERVLRNFEEKKWEVPRRDPLFFVQSTNKTGFSIAESESQTKNPF